MSNKCVLGVVMYQESILFVNDNHDCLFCGWQV